jgi:formate dehydrogenase assembly factor FdhD
MRTYLTVNGSHAAEVKGVVVAELPLTVYVNGQRLVTMLCSTFEVDALGCANAGIGPGGGRP